MNMIHYMVGWCLLATICGREQKAKSEETAIRRRFVPESFYFLREAFVKMREHI